MRFIILLAIVLAVTCSCSNAAPSPTREVTATKPVKASGDSFDIPNDDLNNAMDDNNIIILPYDPIEPKQVDYKTSASREPNSGTNKLKSSSFTVLERESAVRDAASTTSSQAKRPYLMVGAVGQGDAERSGSPNVEKMKDIALNSREVRFIGNGPNKREIEMQDDLPSKVSVALENLGKEAKEVFEQLNEKLDKGWTDIKRSEVWGQVNDKLDKGWTDLKGMVESVVAPSSANKSG